MGAQSFQRGAYGPENLRQSAVRDLKKSVCFLAACETDGVGLSRCSPYIRTRPMIGKRTKVASKRRRLPGLATPLLARRYQRSVIAAGVEST